MFKNKENYKEYLEKQKVEIPYLDESNYFQHSENGEIILKKQDCNVSSIDVERYTNCINWILLKDKKTMALLKRPFGDIYRQLTKEQYNIALYNNILLPQIAKQFQNKSAMYYIVKGNRLSNNLKHILTIDFKETNEELIHGEDILEEAGGDINELDIKTIISYINKYLEGIGAKTQDIDTIQKEFIKQSFYNRFVKQSDENNHNWGILVNNQENRARIAPIYDLDCCCEVGTLRKNVRTTSDGSKYNIEGFFKDFGQYRWFNMYTKEIIEDFDINKAIKNSKSETGIDIPQEVKEYYKTFFGERYYALKSAYQEYLEKGTSEEKEENQAR